MARKRTAKYKRARRQRNKERDLERRSQPRDWSTVPVRRHRVYTARGGNQMIFRFSGVLLPYDPETGAILPEQKPEEGQ